jgi:hypothetical protein
MFQHFSKILQHFFFNVSRIFSSFYKCSNIFSQHFFGEGAAPAAPDRLGRSGAQALGARPWLAVPKLGRGGRRPAADDVEQRPDPAASGGRWRLRAVQGRQ